MNLYHYPIGKNMPDKTNVVVEISKDTNIIDMENQISSKIGMKVYINNKRNKDKIDTLCL